MFKSMAYNVAVDPAKGSKYSREQTELHRFQATKHRNVGFTYDSRESALRARHAVNNYIHRVGLPLRLRQVGSMLVVVRNKA